MWSTGNVSGMPLAYLRVGVVPAGFELHERHVVRPVAVHLVGAHQDEHGLGRVLAAGFEQVERADGVDVEVVERPLGGQVVAGLGGRVDRPGRTGRSRNSRSTPARSRMSSSTWSEVAALAFEPLAIARGVALRAEEVGPHVVVDAGDAESPGRRKTSTASEPIRPLLPVTNTRITNSPGGVSRAVGEKTGRAPLLATKPPETSTYFESNRQAAE